MNIQCPYCKHGMTLKEVKPGKYKPKCSKCEGRFVLTVPADAKAEPLVQAISDPFGTQAAPAVSSSATAPGTAMAAAGSGTKPLPTSDSQAHDQQRRTLDVTLAHSSTEPAAGKSRPVASSTQVAHPQATTSKESGSKGNSSAAVSAPPTPGKREITKSDQNDATRMPRVAAPDDETAAPSQAGEDMGIDEPRGAGTAVEMEATTVDLRPKKNTIPEVLGGYKLVRELGRGAMGAVYLAKQLSLDRAVALKLIQAKWASNPIFVARFMREAYAAAQLTHHNVVQIYDLGCQSDINYYTMEFISGQSLAQLVQKQGKLDAEVAVGYILQAARGLNYAHMQGMVHRDIKPANLLLNDQGVVKVADLGLVKTPHLVEESSSPEETTPITPHGLGSSLAAATAEVTLANIAMGTPAYMAPEQAANAAGVDHRADIYSLGCSLYVLLTGRPPFEGASALEVITKHRTEPILRPEVIVKRIPPELSNIVLKMVAKRPEDRYQSLTDVIKVLEAFLGVHSSGPFSPKEEHAQLLEDSLQLFNNAPLAKVRSLGGMGFLAGCAGLFVILLFVKWWLAGVVAATAIGASLSYLAACGLFERDILFDKVRSYVVSMRLGDWVLSVGTAALALPILWMLGWLFPMLAGLLLGAGFGVAFYFVVEKRLHASRADSLKAMESLLKTLRLRGVEEHAIEQFIAKYSGDHWEEFFETLFGYEAKMKARTELSRSEQGRRRYKFAAWRDGIIRSIDAKLAADRERREQKYLQRVEEANLKAQGKNAAEAKAEAERVAQAQVHAAAEARALPTQETMTPQDGVDPKVIAAQKRAKQLQMLAEARGGKRKIDRESFLWNLIEEPLYFVLSPKLRFLSGVLLVAMFFHWLHINQILQKWDQQAAAAVAVVDPASPEGKANDTKDPDQPNTGEAMQAVSASIFTDLQNVAMDPAKLKPLPYPLFGRLLSHAGTGIAGGILLVLGIFRGIRMSYFALPAACIALFALALGIGWIGYAVAVGLAVFGLLVGRTFD